jgi:hypothetical protein
MDEHVERAAKNVAKTRAAHATAVKELERTIKAAVAEKRITEKDAQALQRKHGN